MKQALGSPLAIGIGAAILTTIIGTTWLQSQSQSTANDTRPHCRTIVADPKPPLNVRTSPIVAEDNVQGRLENGTILTVVDESNGWLQISQPLSGWVYKELTATSCTGTANLSATTATDDPGPQLLAEATHQYHAGNLNGALALAKTVPTNSAAYLQAQAALTNWPKAWQRAANQFYDAQQALQAGRWQDVLAQVRQLPESRYWRSRLTPLIRQAMQEQTKSS